MIQLVEFESEFLGIVFKLFTFISIVFFGIIIHEFGHALGIILTNSKFIGFGFNLKNFTAFTTAKTYNPESKLFVIISGSIFSVFFFVVLKLGVRHKKNAVLHLAINTAILNELLYWGVSAYIKFGDAYLLLELLNFNSIFFGLLFFIVFIILYIYIILEFTDELNFNIINSSN
ncbi:MAG: hypothetical protein ACFFAH_01930 [Promethearchaeota archaeon]